MNIDDLTIGEAKQLSAMFGGQQAAKSNPKEHPFVGKHCVVRTYAAGVHIGEVVSVDGTEVILKDSRRLWSWEKAFTLSAVAMNGFDVKNSKVACEVPELLLSDMVELIPTTDKAKVIIKGAPTHEPK